MQHQTDTYFSCNGTAPSQEESEALERLGQWPQRPRLLKLVNGNFASKLTADDFHENTTGAVDPGGRLISSEHGSWLLDHL
ncbi:hypothetical protein [Streptomyces sp. NBC_00572]|uniref:hypothetical protein n=1 Tax=Streptomyces sp. NBC_00572 TaxID=2903664 RepID=UPI0022537BA7|nr:hypothetical protein [Streptomyces sp. NBC_00572]MCX4985550.1 hypothetical protein [Streptomyces sp. NBC_00572]